MGKEVKTDWRNEEGGDQLWRKGGAGNIGYIPLLSFWLTQCCMRTPSDPGSLQGHSDL